MSCFKRWFSSRISAQRAITELRMTSRARGRNNERYLGIFEPYRCEDCGRFHVGHRYTKRVNKEVE